MYSLETGGSRGRGHPPDSQSLLRPEHHPTRNLFPFMETVFHSAGCSAGSLRVPVASEFVWNVTVNEDKFNVFMSLVEPKRCN